LDRFKKILIVSVTAIVLLICSLSTWFVLSSQPPPYQRVPVFDSDFKNYTSNVVVNRSQGSLHDSHMAIASVNIIDNYTEAVFLGLKLTGFHYNPPQSVGNLTWESIVISRLDILASLSYRQQPKKQPNIEGLSLTCAFNESLEVDIFAVGLEPDLGFLYNLQLVNRTDHIVSSSEPFITWKGVGNYPVCAAVIASYPINFVLWNVSANYEFLLTLTLVYSYDSSTRNQISTPLCIAIED
jgi:hypothetical protein